MSETTPGEPTLPPDDLTRNLAVSQADMDGSGPQFGLVSDAYTITVTGADTGGRCAWQTKCDQRNDRAKQARALLVLTNVPRRLPPR